MVFAQSPRVSSSFRPTRVEVYSPDDKKAMGHKRLTSAILGSGQSITT